MRLCQQVEATLCHVVSQLCYRWISVSYLQKYDSERCDLTSFRLDDWLCYIEMRYQDGMDAPWKRLMKKVQLSPIGLATVIYANLCQIVSAGGEFIDFYHSAYPHLLKHIPDAPAGFSMLGSLELLTRPKVAIVGSRKARPISLRKSKELGFDLARMGRVVVSGGAIGCDTAAHMGALESHLVPAPTLVVLAGGLSQFHPACNREMFSRLRERGAGFISERLWEFPARPRDFPVRNRIIAGLSSELIVIQAAERSGALKTASYALEQGRDVYAFRHEAQDIQALGSNRLLEEGAIPLGVVEGNDPFFM